MTKRPGKLRQRTGHHAGQRPWNWNQNEQVVTAVRARLRSADYCFRGAYVCQLYG